jgi:hypothetical protein
MTEWVPLWQDLHAMHVRASLGALMAGPDVGAYSITSVGDGALLHGTGAGAIGAGTGVGAGTGSSCRNARTHAHLGACIIVPDVGANPITSVGDGTLFHGAGAGWGLKLWCWGWHWCWC